MIPLPRRLIAIAFLALAPALAFANGKAEVAVAGVAAPGESAGILIPRADATKANLYRRARPVAVALAPDVRQINPPPGLAGRAQEYDVHPKSEWSDDQGFHVDAAGVGYKRRF